MHAAMKYKRMADLVLRVNDDRVGLSLRKYEEQKVFLVEKVSARLPPRWGFSGPLIHASLGVVRGDRAGCSRWRDQSAAGIGG